MNEIIIKQLTINGKILSVGGDPTPRIVILDKGNKTVLDVSKEDAQAVAPFIYQKVSLQFDAKFIFSSPELIK